MYWLVTYQLKGNTNTIVWRYVQHSTCREEDPAVHKCALWLYERLGCSGTSQARNPMKLRTNIAISGKQAKASMLVYLMLAACAKHQLQWLSTARKHYSANSVKMRKQLQSKNAKQPKKNNTNTKKNRLRHLNRRWTTGRANVVTKDTLARDPKDILTRVHVHLSTEKQIRR